jgi:uncharacterized protein YbaR (Trm112 family)
MTERQRWYLGLTDPKTKTKDLEIICCPRCNGSGKIISKNKAQKAWYQANKQRLKEARLRKQLVSVG